MAYPLMVCFQIEKDMDGFLFRKICIAYHLILQILYDFMFIKVRAIDNFRSANQYHDSIC